MQAKCFLANIKTCKGHCQIFLHHSPQGGNLGMKVSSLEMASTCDDDLHFRFAFPWYSYSPTLKFRQLDMTTGNEWTPFPSFVHCQERGEGGKVGGWWKGGRQGWCVSLHCNPQLASASRFPYPDYSLSRKYDLKSHSSLFHKFLCFTSAK